MIDTSQPGEPGWWLHRLLRKLSDGRDRCDLLEAYYTCQAGLPTTSTRATREAYRRLMQISRTNYAELVVEAVRERMRPAGFRTGAASDELGDSEAWRIWQANSLDADSALVHRNSLVMGDAYVIVGGPDPDRESALITPEDPREVIVEHDPVRHRKPRAALKVFTDDVTSTAWAHLFLPGVVYKAARQSPAGQTFTSDVGGWEWQSQETLPYPVIPVVAFPNRTLNGRTWGEFEPHLGLLDRITYVTLNRLEIATLQAFRQRAVKGTLPATDPETGETIDYDDVFAADPGALWQLPEGVELWESGQVDLSGVLNATKDDVQALAVVTRTPLFYISPDAANGSAEGASLQREGLTFKVEDRLATTSESWEAVMSLAFLFAGDEVRSRRGDMEVLWSPVERFSLAERYDAAAKAQAAGVPWRTVMRDVLQFSPQQIDRMEAERATDALLSFTPEPEPAGGGGR